MLKCKWQADRQSPWASSLVFCVTVAVIGAGCNTSSSGFAGGGGNGGWGHGGCSSSGVGVGSSGGGSGAKTTAKDYMITKYNFQIRTMKPIRAVSVQAGCFIWIQCFKVNLSTATQIPMPQIAIYRLSSVHWPVPWNEEIYHDILLAATIGQFPQEFTFKF